MLQRARSKSISKARYFIVLPVILAMLTIVACSDGLLPGGDPNLEKYNYTLVKGDEKSSEKDAENYLKFLDENPEYVGWRIIDQKKETIEYSIHSKHQSVPDDYKGYEYILSNGKESVHYVKEINPYANTTRDKQIVEGIADIPFAVIDQVPLFPGCENLSSHEEQKACISDNITKYVTTNYDTSLGKKLGLTGLNRIMVVFKINAEGDIAEVRARAPHPDLEAEAIRVVESLPKMLPGVHNGQKVGVSYALPIQFQVSK